MDYQFMELIYKMPTYKRQPLRSITLYVDLSLVWRTKERRILLLEPSTEASLQELITGVMSERRCMKWVSQAVQLILKFGCDLALKMMVRSIGSMYCCTPMTFYVLWNILRNSLERKWELGLHWRRSRLALLPNTSVTKYQMSPWIMVPHVGALAHLSMFKAPLGTWRIILTRQGRSCHREQSHRGRSTTDRNPTSRLSYLCVFTWRYRAGNPFIRFR